MDVSLIVGWILGIILIVFGIGVEKVVNFIDVPSVIIVIGGMIAALIASYPFRMLVQMPKHIKIMLGSQKYDAGEVIYRFADMAQTARKRGLLVLEEQAALIQDPFLKQSVMLIVDAVDAERIREILEGEVNALIDRHEQQISIYEKCTSLAPAFGLIGTLVGLINMLKGVNMDQGAGSIGADMSLALIATFYGCILAHLVFAPMAKKLRIRNEEEVIYKQIIIEGVLSIQAGDNPKFLVEKLFSYLSQSQQKKFMRNGSTGGYGGDAAL
jgi:chemotaxis protein MotA